MTPWRVCKSSDPRALALADRHYSRRTPGSKTFTGVGREIVLISDCERALWAVVYQRTPSRRGSGASRGRDGQTDSKPRYIWRNMMFRNESDWLSSELIRRATAATYNAWGNRYGGLPPERLRTEIDIKAVRSINPGYCYKKAGWRGGEIVRGKLYLYAPERTAHGQ